MFVILNLAVLAIFLFATSLSLALWAWAGVKLSRGEAILEPQPRSLPPVGLSELLIGFGVFVLTSTLLAPLLVPKSETAVATKSVADSSQVETTVQDTSKLTEESDSQLPSDNSGDTAGVETSESQEDEAIGLDQLVAMILLNSIATVVASLAILFWMKVTGISLTRAGFLPTVQHLGIGIVGAVMILPPIMIFQAILASQIRYEHPLLNVLQQQVPWPTMITMAVSASIVAPLAEELYFRGVFQGWLERLSAVGVTAQDRPEIVTDEIRFDYSTPISDRYPVGATSEQEASSRVAIASSIAEPRRSIWPGVLASLLFALVHLGQGPAPISLFFLALGIAYLYRQTGSIWPGIVVHFVLNGTSTTVMMLTTLLGGEPQG